MLTLQHLLTSSLPLLTRPPFLLALPQPTLAPPPFMLAAVPVMEAVLPFLVTRQCGAGVARVAVGVGGLQLRRHPPP
eukprot:358974-Rhodomonas_salina.1